MNISQLRKAFSELPFADEQPSDWTWERHRWEIARHVKNDDPGRFLRWSTINATMFVNVGDLLLKEYEILQQSDEWPRWRKAIREPRFGDPPIMDGFTSANLVHQAYHLYMWEKMANYKITDLDRIFDFGGGYGAMALIVKQMGFVGAYAIMDIPEFLLIQMYYLSNVNVPVGLCYEAPDEDFGLVIGSYSFSEVPIELRENVLKKAKGYNYLFVYQDIYHDIDNVEWFRKFADSKPWLDWHEIEIEHLPGNRYLIGVEQ